MTQELTDKLLAESQERLKRLDKFEERYRILKEEMLKEIFIFTGGRPENPEIAERCASIAMDFLRELPNYFIVDGSTEGLEEAIARAGYISFSRNPEGDLAYAKKGLTAAGFAVISEQKLRFALNA
jgi:hypothetical protein